MSESRTTHVTTDVKSFVVNFLAADACGYGAYWFATNTGAKLGVIPYFLAGLLACAAAYFLYRALRTTGVAACPGCGMQIDRLSRTRNLGVFCRCCGRFVEGENGELILSPDDRVARVPVFKTELPYKIRWPEGCCVCGEQATREVEATLRREKEVNSAAAFGKDMAVRTVSLGALKRVEKQVTTVSVQVPHCDAHDDGASLLIAGDNDDPALGFRWHGYARNFCDLNDTLPVDRM